MSQQLRGDAAACAAYATAGIVGGWLTGNDVRRMGGLNNAGPELDVYCSPINYENAERLLDPHLHRKIWYPMPHRTKELRYQAAKELRVQTCPDGSRTITGAIFYNQESDDLGGFTEVLAPGCFSSSVKGDVYCLQQHIATIILGRTKSKTLALTDDTTALRFVCKLPDTTQAADLAMSIERGDLDGVSFGFRTIQDSWAEGAAWVRTIVQAELLEVSPCIFAAYPSATVSLRSCPDALRSKLKRSVRTHADGCDCPCPGCSEDDCSSCSDDECEDEACAANGCPNQDDEERTVSSSDLHKMHMRLELARHK